MEKMIKIKVLDDFNDTPGPRYIKEGACSGEDFRKRILFPKLQEAISNNLKLIVDLDGTEGYGTSFLEEAFGGLIRENKISVEQIRDTIIIISDEEDYLKDEIEEYIADAAKEVSENDK